MESVVEVWTVRLEGSAEVQAAFAALLSSEETDRARRFRCAELFHRFILSHGALRILLGQYTGISPKEISYSLGSRGKPQLSRMSTLRHKLIQFNMSHSGDLAFYAFTDAETIGADIEEMRELADMGDIARRFFSTGECEDLLAIPESERKQGFFHCWTRKEAFLKATGDGLSAPLDSFRVEFRPGHRPKMHEVPVSCRNQIWQVENVITDPRYAASVVYSGEPRSIQCYTVEARELLAADLPKKVGVCPKVMDGHL